MVMGLKRFNIHYDTVALGILYFLLFIVNPLTIVSFFYFSLFYSVLKVHFIEWYESIGYPYLFNLSVLLVVLIPLYIFAFSESRLTRILIPIRNIVDMMYTLWNHFPTIGVLRNKHEHLY